MKQACNHRYPDGSHNVQLRGSTWPVRQVRPLRRPLGVVSRKRLGALARATKTLCFAVAFLSAGHGVHSGPPASSAISQRPGCDCDSGKNEYTDKRPQRGVKFNDYSFLGEAEDFEGISRTNASSCSVSSRACSSPDLSSNHATRRNVASCRDTCSVSDFPPRIHWQHRHGQRSRKQCSNCR